MQKISSQAELLDLYNQSKTTLALRLTSEHDIKSVKKDILCCGGTGCHASEAQLLMDNLREEIKKNGLEADVRVIQTGCFGFCAQGPIVKVMPDNVFYVQVTPGDAKEIVEKHIVGKELVERLLGVKADTEPTADGLFSISALRCVGACGLAPVMIINGKVYGKLSVAEAIEIINEYKAQG